MFSLHSRRLTLTLRPCPCEVEYWIERGVLCFASDHPGLNAWTASRSMPHVKHPARANIWNTVTGKSPSESPKLSQALQDVYFFLDDDNFLQAVQSIRSCSGDNSASLQETITKYVNHIAFEWFQSLSGLEQIFADRILVWFFSTPPTAYLQSDFR